MSTARTDNSAVEAPLADFTQEIRFAIVMYGGISLAIYMNGVAQEFLRLVRATAPTAAQRGTQRRALRTRNELDGTERVYRKLGQMLARKTKTKDLSEVEADSPIHTRFVVDILSGSSAGGINAIYLAKALVVDQPMEGLKDLWVKEGDIGVLVNDDKSTDEAEMIAPQRPPRSVLNSRRMYWKLLDALDSVDNSNRNVENTTPNVEELDLYVTATDMTGQVVPLQLADKVVKERRHRNVFHFCYGRREHDDSGDGLRHDFRARYNPFLAYAARCTSAHPAAFEPMRLADIDEVLENHPSYEDKPDLRARNVEWRRFFREYLLRKYGDQEKLAERFLKRDFSDGGVLDNRPFRYTTDAMPSHPAEVPVDRKLVYIEPTPEHPELAREIDRKPSFFENVWLSLSTLPRYEPIQEDLQRVLERNRLIERVNSIIVGVDEDLLYQEASDQDGRLPRTDPPTNEEWDEKSLAEMVNEKGPAWTAYQRLRVANATDDLALLVSRVAGLDEDSDEFLAVRHLVRRWRTEHYDAHKRDGKRSENEFLRRFDYEWYLRRLKYTLKKIDEMHAFDKRGQETLAQATWYLATEDVEPHLREVLLAKKTGLNGVYADLRTSRQQLWGRRENHPLRGAVRAMNLNPQDLIKMLGPQAGKDEGLDGRVETEYAKRVAQFNLFGDSVQREMGPILERASDRYEAVMAYSEDDGRSADQVEAVALEAVRYYYDGFDRYDMVAYPILHATEVGDETDIVDVFRISPEDATNLFHDRPGNPKLAGTALNNFGAFFKERFRINDIVWGQLDGAERIISALLPNAEDETNRKALINEAHRIIIAEEIFAKQVDFTDEVELHRLLEEAIKYERSEAQERAQELLSELADRLGDSSIDDTLQPPLRAYLKGKDPLDYFKENCRTGRQLDPRETVRNTARASRVFGDMLDGYAQEQRSALATRAVWVTRLTRVFWGLVEVAVPDSVSNLVFHHWVKLLYFFEALMILLGTLLLNPKIQQFGFVAFAVTATTHTAVLFLGDRMQGSGRWWNVAKYLFAGFMVVTSALGLLIILAMLGMEAPWRFVEFVAEPRESGLRIVLRGLISTAVVLTVLVLASTGLRRQKNDPKAIARQRSANPSSLNSARQDANLRRSGS